MNQSATEFILALARKFPCLEPKLREWKPLEFDANHFYEMTRAWSTSERHVVSFVLTVWNPDYARERNWTFDAVEAVSCLDPVNGKPILEWMAHPYYP